MKCSKTFASVIRLLRLGWKGGRFQNWQDTINANIAAIAARLMLIAPVASELV